MKLSSIFVLLMALAFAAPAALAQQSDESAAPQPADVSSIPPRPDQMLYKGVVGNLLEAVPMDAQQRIELQRGNALLSAPFSARSLALLLGITNPVVMIGGLIWGIWAASQIEGPPMHATAPPEPAAAGD
jgi:hypothetical protein